MKHARCALPRALRLLALLAAAALPLAARADDQADVTKLMRSGQLVQALAKADQSLAAKPRDPQMRFLKGVLQSDMGRSADAITTFTQLTEDYPELPEPYNNLGVLYAGQSRLDKAREVLEMAIRANPGYAIAHENLGDVYARLASQSYGRAQQLDTANTTAAPKLALIRQLFPAVAKGSAQPAGAKAPGS
jgi:Flp pilus assembly protein TadD